MKNCAFCDDETDSKKQRFGLTLCRRCVSRSPSELLELRKVLALEVIAQQLDKPLRVALLDEEPIRVLAYKE